MMRNLRAFFLPLVACAIVTIATSILQGATILKLNLGGTGDAGGDVALNTNQFSTGSDTDFTTAGEENTDVEFTGFLDSLFPDITTGRSSFSISMGMLANSAPVISGDIVFESFSGNGATFSLYDPANTLLLTGTMGNATLVGTLGQPGTGAFFTTTLQSATGGTLAPLLAPGSVSLSIEMTNVNSGPQTGMRIVSSVPNGVAISSFTANATVNISADPVPEPASVLLLLAGMVGFLSSLRRRWSPWCWD
jgi:hypothetical protein